MSNRFELERLAIDLDGIAIQLRSVGLDNVADNIDQARILIEQTASDASSSLSNEERSAESRE